MKYLILVVFLMAGCIDPAEARKKVMDYYYEVECPALTEKGSDIKFTSEICDAYQSGMIYFEEGQTTRPCFCKKVPRHDD